MLSFIIYPIHFDVRRSVTNAYSLKSALRWAPYVSNNSALEHDEDQEQEIKMSPSSLRAQQ